MAAFSTKFVTRSERSIRPRVLKRMRFRWATTIRVPVMARSLTKSPSWSAADKTCPDRSVRGPWTTPLLCFDLEKESLSFVGVIIRFVGRAAGVPVRIVDKRDSRQTRSLITVAATRARLFR